MARYRTIMCQTRISNHSLIPRDTQKNLPNVEAISNVKTSLGYRWPLAAPEQRIFHKNTMQKLNRHMILYCTMLASVKTDSERQRKRER
ncbi:uncharacterized protein DMAD_05822 [Drosophila madeirensis]|uniref:Uncharacterized protein n=1 Tax=Drosophila madeirensis TaxID=30013 RepID=A0AAU9FP38_DROMD